MFTLQQPPEHLGHQRHVLGPIMCCSLTGLHKPDNAYRRADAEIRGLMNRGFFSAIYIDVEHDAEPDFELSPVFEQLWEIWVERQPRNRPAACEETFGSGIRRRKNPRRSCERGGSKVGSMVRAEGLEPPRC